MTPSRTERRQRQAAEQDWKARAVQVLAGAGVALPRHPWGPAALAEQFCHVAAWDAGFPARPFPGARQVTLVWPPGRPFSPRLWSRLWNQAHGFPHDGPPWTWEYRPDVGAIFGEPFDLTGDAAGRLWLPQGIDYQAHAYRVVQGLCEDGTVLTWDLLRNPHMLLAGGSGSGKSKTLHATLYHLLAADVLQACVILDWKRKDFTVFTRRAWDPGRCAGVTVAKPDLDARGIPDRLDTMLAAAEAVLTELGRRIRDSEDLPEGEDPYLERLVLFVLDEGAATLQRETKPPASDKSDQAEAVRARNGQRDRLEYIVSQVTMLGRAYHVHAVFGAQSPRKEFLPGEAMANVPHRIYLGLYQDVAEPVIMFGRDAPPSPPPWPGYGVWRVVRPTADPADPYLYVKAFWLPASALAEVLDARVLPAASFTVADPEANGQAPSPWLRAA